MTKDKPVLEKLISNPVFGNVLMILFLVGGIVSYQLSIREIFPEVKLDMINVQVVYPGADPDEIEESICRPIEDNLEGITGVKKVKTTATEGLGSATIEILENYEPSEVRNDVENRINAITTFPLEAEKPLISQANFTDDVVKISVWGDTPLEVLKETAYRVKDRLLAKDGISNATILGDQDYEISIEISDEKLKALSLSHSEISRILRQHNFNMPGGQIYTKHEDIRLRFLGRRYRAEEFSDIVIKTNGQGGLVRLKDVATIKDSFDPDNRSISLFNGKPSVTLQIMKTEKEDAIRMSSIVREFVEDEKKVLPSTINIDYWADSSRMIKDRVDLLTRNGMIGLLLVFCCLWLFLDFKLSFWVTLGIPISLSGGFILMYMTGTSLNMVTLFAVILVLGIIVDDAIIVGESIYVHRENMNSIDAAVHGTRDVLAPVFSAVLTTIVAFTPLFFIDGVMGKFVEVMPIPIVAALAVSLVEALIILPIHLRHLPPKAQRQPKWKFVQRLNKGRLFFSEGLVHFINKVYGPFLKFFLKWRYATIAFTMFCILLIVGLVRSGIVKTETFPSADTDFLFANLTMPVGTPLNETRKKTAKMIKAWENTQTKYAGQLNGENLSKALYSISGSGINPESGPQQGTHLATVFVELLPTEIRNIHYEDIVEEWSRQCGNINGAEELSIDGFDGAPSTADIDIDLKSESTVNLIKATAELQNQLKTYEGVYDITSNYKKGKTEYHIRLKPAAENFGITLETVSTQLRDAYYGNEVMKVQRGRDEVRIMLRFSEEERAQVASLKKIKIRNPQGIELPLELVAYFEQKNGFSVINRRDNQRYINVKAKTIKGIDPNDIMNDLFDNYLPKLAQKLGVNSEIGEMAQDTVDTGVSMMQGFLVATLVIYLIIATIFKSYVQPLIIIFTIPFGIIGAISGHIVYGIPVSTMSFFGMIALTGVVVNDSIVYIEAVNRRLDKGETLENALIDGGKNRFRAIILTTLTTFGGIFPMIMERSFQAQVLIPTAISVAFGLVFATFSTLVAIPCLINIGNDIRRFYHLLLYGTYVSPVAVEPRSNRYHLKEKRGSL